jgi:glucoamylase
MLEKAVGCLLRVGPTGVDRWEETPGTSPFSLGVAVAALVAAAQTMQGANREYVLSVADNWNERLEEFTYVSGSLVDRHFHTAGHYVRIGPAADPVRLGNQPPANGEDTYVPAARMVGLEFLYLARLGLRDPHDDRIADTLVVVDRMLKRQTPAGEAFLRYDMDGYGEWIDGSGWPVRQYGIGRPWPLLCGERGHFEVLTGADPTPRLLAMLSMRGRGGLLPEQVWDADELPWRNLAPGKPTGSAMPLAWAHSELIKLAVTATSGNGRPVEYLKVVEDYYPDRTPKETTTWYWRDNGPVRALPAGCTVVVESTREFNLHYGFDGWQPETIADRPATAQPFGLWGVPMTPEMLHGHSTLQFTRRYNDGSWDATNSTVVLGAHRPVAAGLPLPPREFAGR